MDRTENAADGGDARRNIWIEWDRALDAMRRPSMFGPGAKDAIKLHRVAGEIALFAQQRGRPMPVLAKLRAALEDMITDPTLRPVPRELLRDAVAEVDMFVTELRAAVQQDRPLAAETRQEADRELPGPWVPVSMLIDENDPQLRDHKAVQRFCEKHGVPTRPGERAQRREVHHDSFQRKKRELGQLASSELDRVEAAKLDARAEKARKTSGG